MNFERVELLESLKPLLEELTEWYVASEEIYLARLGVEGVTDYGKLGGRPRVSLL